MASNLLSLFDPVQDVLTAVGFLTTVAGMIYWTHFLLAKVVFEPMETEFSDGLQWGLAICMVLSTAGAGLSTLVTYYGLLLPLVEIGLAALGGSVAVLSIGQLLLWAITNV